MNTPTGQRLALGSLALAVPPSDLSPNHRKKAATRMAEIKFTAFVEDWTKNQSAHPDWAMKTAESHSKKEGDQYVTIGRTYRTVKGGYENGSPVSINFTQFKKGDRVDVVGKEVTETREHDGKKFHDLVVKATSVTLARSGNAPVQSAAEPATSWNMPDAELPF